MHAITKRITGYAVASPEAVPATNSAPQFVDEADRRLHLASVPDPVVDSLRWEKRPRHADGNPSWTYTVDTPQGRFGVLVGHVENGRAYPFECWILGEAPRGLTAIARSLSMDMRSRDRGWLKRKLDALERCSGTPFDMQMPDGSWVRARSEVAAMARLVKHRCEVLKAFNEAGATPILDALMASREPKTRSTGGISWYVDIHNPATGDDFALFLKEIQLPDGRKRPLSIWMDGDYPHSLNGLCKTLSLDLQVVDVEWPLRKLRQLIDVAELNGGFRAEIPGTDKTAEYPSTVAYVASLILHRFQVLGWANEAGSPTSRTGAVSLAEVRSRREAASEPERAGRLCDECGAYAVARVSGCDTCGACGASHCS